MKFLISGGGICGLTMAIVLEQQGHQVEVFEAATEIKAIGAGLVLSTNAVKALSHIGIDQAVLAKANLLDNFDIALANGERLFETDALAIGSKYNSVGNATIHRAELHIVLLDLLKDRITFHTGKRAQKAIQDREGVTLTFEDGTSVGGDFLIACDGINSPIRQHLLPKSQPRYAGYTCWRAVVQYDGQFDSKNATETWGRHGRFGVVPLTDNRIYWFACLNATIAKDPKMKAYQVIDLKACFKDYHHPIPQLLDLTADKDLLWNDIEDIKPIQQFAFDRILLAGDAAHATTPNMGQGACQAIEDAAVLLSCLKEHESTIAAFHAFEKRRITRTTKIVNDSWTFGKLAQMTNPFFIAIRNFVLKMTPKSVNEKQMNFLFNVEF